MFYQKDLTERFANLNLKIANLLILKCNIIVISFLIYLSFLDRST